MYPEDLASLNNLIQEFEEKKTEFSDILYRLKNVIEDIEKKLDKNFNLSHILNDLNNIVDNINPEEAFNFVDDLDEEVKTLDYKYSKAQKANGISVYKFNAIKTPAFRPK